MTPKEIAAFVDGLSAAIAGGDEEAMRFAAAMAAERSRNGASGAIAFWRHLGSGAYSDEASVRESASAAGVRLESAYLAVALETDEPHDGQLRRLCSAVFGTPDSDLGIVENAKAVELLVPAAREVDASNARTAATLLPKTIGKRKLTLRITGGVGGYGPPVAAPENLRRARTALAIGRRIYGSGGVHVYDDLGAYTLLHAGASAQELRTFSQRVLGPLREYDRKHGTEHERTLRIYFASGQNVKTAAAELNVHRHTVFYRLRQIAELCGSDLAAAHGQLTLRLAMAIDALHS
ncbi:MAG: PucR family transcriptional regulator [Candidatus Tyrphobacter sp.]